MPKNALLMSIRDWTTEVLYRNARCALSNKAEEVRHIDKSSFLKDDEGVIG
jgi:hypothetical protein